MNRFSLVSSSRYPSGPNLGVANGDAELFPKYEAPDAVNTRESTSIWR